MRLTTAMVIIMAALTEAQAHCLGYDIIIQAGQSQEVGLGRGRYLDILDNRAFDRRIFQVGRTGQESLQIVSASEDVGEETVDALQHWNNRTPGEEIGHGLHLARRYVYHWIEPRRCVILVPGAKFGTTVEQWLNQSAQANPPLYSDLLERADVALSQPGKNRIVAIVWAQIEGNIQNYIDEEPNSDPDTYEANLKTLFRRFRRDFGAQVPILGIGGTDAWLSGVSGMRSVKSRFERARINALKSFSNTANIQTAGLLSNAEEIDGDDDDQHFSARSQIRIGLLAWRALKPMLPE